MSRSGTYDLKYGFIPDDDCEKPTTNGDRIRQMTDAELAEQIVKCVEADFFRANVIGTKTNSKEDWLDWLKQEADNGA